MFQAKPITRALAIAFGGLACTAIISPALAQTTPPSTQQLERVEITGSAIKRIEGESALPVTTSRARKSIKWASSTPRSWSTSWSPTRPGLQPIANALGDAARPGFSAASLRGLGGNSTLILLNGRRMAVYAFDGGAVNLQQIPFAAIDRVEVLREGASAIYGTDAVARRDQLHHAQGLFRRAGLRRLLPAAGRGRRAVSGQHPRRLGRPRQGPFQRLRRVCVHQAGVGRGEGPRFLEDGAAPRHLDRSECARLRVMRSGPARTRFPANISAASGFRSPYAPAFTGATPGVTYGSVPGYLPVRRLHDSRVLRPAVFRLNPGSRAWSAFTETSIRCRYDYASQIDILPENEVMSFLGRGTFQLNADTQIFAEASWAKQTSTFRISQTPASEATTKKQPDGTNAAAAVPGGRQVLPGQRHRSGHREQARYR